jgi:hypothetical protein
MFCTSAVCSYGQNIIEIYHVIYFICSHTDHFSFFPMKHIYMEYFKAVLSEAQQLNLMSCLDTTLQEHGN